MPKYRESLKDAFDDRILAVLGIFAVLSIITGMIYNPLNGWIEGVTILIAIVIMVLITSFNDWSKDKCFVELQQIAREASLPAIRGKHG